MTLASYLTILQLSHPVGPERLERVYRKSRERYLRLTARGPLRFYRNDLLTAVERAYRSLKNPPVRISARPLSLTARRAASLSQRHTKPPVKSSIKKTSILSGRMGGALPKKQCKDPLTEDKFCREVIYRLEGDLIRYDARRELLQLAGDWGIPLFRANLLTAQIVQAVRQHRLYLPTPSERNEERIKDAKNNSPKQWLIAALIGLVLAVIIDILLIYTHRV